MDRSPERTSSRRLSVGDPEYHTPENTNRNKGRRRPFLDPEETLITSRERV